MEEKGKKMGNTSQEMGRPKTKQAPRTHRVGSANTARQRFLYGGKAKFVADEKFIAEAKILAK